jgi:hypothetical protein
MKIRDFNPAEGLALQGDVSILAVPAKIAAKLNRSEEIRPEANRLILQAGEVTGHHHAIYFLSNIPRFHDTALSATLEAKSAMPGKAKLYRDPEIVTAMQKEGLLTRTDLTVGLLEVESPVVVSHEEHDGLRLPPGAYLIGRQVESVGAEERRVAD